MDDNMTRAYTKVDAQQALDRAISWINTADNKAAIIIAVISFLFGSGLLILSPESLLALGQSETGYRVVFVVLAYLTLLSMLISLLVSIVTVVATLIVRDKVQVKSKGPDKKITFFHDISKSEYQNFKKDITTITEEELMEDLIHQIYVVSTIAHKKYKNLKTCYATLAISFISSILYSLFCFLLTK